MFRIVIGTILCVLFPQMAACADSVRISASFQKQPAADATVHVQTLSRPARYIPDEKPLKLDQKGEMEVDLSSAFGERKLLIVVYFKGKIGKRVIEANGGKWPKDIVQITCEEPDG